jgi:hypothetical protein
MNEINKPFFLSTAQVNARKAVIEFNQRKLTGFINPHKVDVSQIKIGDEVLVASSKGNVWFRVTGTKQGADYKTSMVWLESIGNLSAQHIRQVKKVSVMKAAA